MGRKICVVTRCSELGRKIQLALLDDEVILSETMPREGYEYVLCDIDSCENPEGEFVRMSRRIPTGQGTLHLPFRYSELRAAISENSKKNAYLGIDRVNSTAILGEERIKLTEVEMRLYERLYSSDGYVSRGELLEYVWHGESEAGVLNVYIHYLREKLEKWGEKIILSSRKLGYKINEIYRR